MAVRSRLVLPATVRELGDRIEQWRKSRAHVCAMPAELWTEAEVLARVHGVYAIAHALRLSYDALKKRVGKHSEVRLHDQQVDTQRFVELQAGVPIFGVAQTDTVIEITNGVGDRLAIWLSAQAHLDVSGLASAFMARRP